MPRQVDTLSLALQALGVHMEQCGFCRVPFCPTSTFPALPFTGRGDDAISVRHKALLRSLHVPPDIIRRHLEIIVDGSHWSNTQITGVSITTVR